jgi:hypothetical protein
MMDGVCGLEFLLQNHGEFSETMPFGVLGASKNTHGHKFASRFGVFRNCTSLLKLSFMT